MEHRAELLFKIRKS